MPQYATRIGQAVRKLARGRIEKDAHGLLRLRAENDHTRKQLLRLARHSVNVQNTVRAIVRRVHQDFVDHSVRNQRAVSRSKRIRYSRERRIEIGVRHAAALARAAIMARAAAVQRLRQIGAARGRDYTAELLANAFAEKGFLARQWNRRLKEAIRKMFDRFLAAADAYVSLDEIVVRLKFFVTQRPVFAVAVARGSPEVPIAESQAKAAPDVRAPAGDAQTPHPVKWLVRRSRIRLFKIVREPVSVVFVASKFGLDRPRLAQNFRSHVTVLQFEGRLVLGEILVGLRPACFEQRDFQSGFRQALARPAARSAGTYNDNVVKVVLSLRHAILGKNGC